MFLFFCACAQKAKRLLFFWRGATKTEGFVWQSGPVDPWHQFLCLHLPFVFVCTLIFTSSLFFTLLHKLFVHFPFFHNLVFRQNAGFSFTILEISIETGKVLLLIYWYVQPWTTLVFCESTNKHEKAFAIKGFTSMDAAGTPTFYQNQLEEANIFSRKAIICSFFNESIKGMHHVGL